MGELGPVRRRELERRLEEALVSHEEIIEALGQLVVTAADIPTERLRSSSVLETF